MVATDRTAKLIKYRIADALVCFLILKFTFGFFPALVFSIPVLISAKLKWFKSVLPDNFYDDFGYPTFFAEELLPMILLSAISAILMFAGYNFGGMLLGIMVVLDLFRNQIDVQSFITKKCKYFGGREKDAQ